MKIIIRTATTIQVIPWPSADGRRQKWKKRFVNLVSVNFPHTVIIRDTYKEKPHFCRCCTTFLLLLPPFSFLLRPRIIVHAILENKLKNCSIVAIGWKTRHGTRIITTYNFLFAWDPMHSINIILVMSHEWVINGLGFSFSISKKTTFGQVFSRKNWRFSRPVPNAIKLFLSKYPKVSNSNNNFECSKNLYNLH